MSHDRSKKWHGEPDWDDEDSIETANTEQLSVPFDEALPPIGGGRSPTASTRLIEAPPEDVAPPPPSSEAPAPRARPVSNRAPVESKREKSVKSIHPVFGGAAGVLQPTQVGRTPLPPHGNLGEGIGKPRLGLGALSSDPRTPETKAAISVPPMPIRESPPPSRPEALAPSTQAAEKKGGDSPSPAPNPIAPSSETSPQSAITTAKFVPPPPVTASPNKSVWESLQLRSSSHRTWILLGMTVAALMLAVFVDRDPPPPLPANAPEQAGAPNELAPHAQEEGFPEISPIKTFQWDSLAWPTNDHSKPSATEKVSTKKAVDSLMSGKREEAIEEYEALTKHDPANQIYTTIARILRKEVAESCKNGIRSDGTPCDSKPESK